MARKIFWTLVGIIVLVIVAASAFVYTNPVYLNYFTLRQLPVILYGAQNPLPGTPYSPAISTTTVSTGGVKVIAITPSSVTVQISTTTTATYTISSKTPVYSIVFAGQTGKSLSDITVGTNVIVYDVESELPNIRSIAIQRDPSLMLTPGENSNSVTGKITSLSASSVTITPANTAGAPVTIALVSSTNVVTAVLAGQKGRTMAVGDTVAASGLVTAGGKTTAKLILLAPIVQ